MSRSNRRPRVGAVVGAVVTMLLAGAGAARADEIVVKGDTIHGKIVAVTAAKVEIAVPYGKDQKLSIPVEDIQQITSDGEFVFAAGDAPETRGRIVGIRDGAFLVGTSAASASAVPASGISLVTGSQLLEESTLARVKNALRYWGGNVDIGVGYSQGTIDSTTFSLIGQARRVKGPFRLLFDAGWLYGTQQRIGDSRTALADRVYGGVRGEYDLTPRIFVYGDGKVEYNGVQELSIRGIPQAGLGYKLWKSSAKDSKDYLAATVGGAWVYEKYFGGLHQDYFSAAFGLDWWYTLPYAGAVFDGRVQYLPSVSDFTRDYLLQTDIGLSIPVWKQVAVRFALSDVYDGTPAPGTTYNYLVTNFGLSLFL